MTDTLIGPKYDPSGIWVGALRPGRICFDHRGNRVKILTQGPGSTTVRRRRIDKERKHEEIAISTHSVVYPSRKEVPA